MSIAIDAIDYVQTVSFNSPNGWGQQIHPEFGQSHGCLWHYERKHGKDRFHKALDILFRKGC